MTIQKKEIHFEEKVPNRVEMQDAQKHLPCLKPLHIITDLKKPIMTEISQFDRVNLTVEVNFPRNSMIITYTTARNVKSKQDPKSKRHIKMLYKSHLKHHHYSHYPHEKMVFSNSFEHVKFIWLPSIKFIENLQLE